MGIPNFTTGVFNQTDVVDTVVQQLTELWSMAVPHHGTRAAAIGSRIYVPGGGLQQDRKSVTTNGTMTFQRSTTHFDA
jgi:hypothetical protein